MKKICALIMLCSIMPTVANAENRTVECEESKETKEALLRSYEPNRIGWTFDDNDVGYMDFTVSLMYPVFFRLNDAIDAKMDENQPDFLTKYLRPVPYFAFTGRLGQYLETRDSSPVIGKRFNPKIFLRFFTSCPASSYLDIGYAHESNGQRIHSAESYQELRGDFANEGEDPEFANDYISRGWDYWEARWFKNFNGTSHGFSTDISLKYFMEDGYLQGEAEEFNSWENSREGKRRKQVDGITVKLAYERDFKDLYRLPIGFGGGNLIYTTGYKNSFSNNTIRGEYWLRLWTLPILFWVSEGYNSDLIDYYQRVRSSGFCLYLQTFLD